MTNIQEQINELGNYPECAHVTPKRFSLIFKGLMEWVKELVPFSYGDGRHAVTLNNAANYATGDNSMAIGNSCSAEGYAAFACGNMTTAGDTAHSEGYKTRAIGLMAHAEGDSCVASGKCSHAEGDHTTASGINAHAEGSGGSTASGEHSHAQGWRTTASGNKSHSGGEDTVASGECAHAEGYKVTAKNFCEFSCGKQNYTHTNPNNPGDHTIFSVGIGSGEVYENGLEVMANGDIYILKNGNRVLLQSLI